MFEFFFAGPPEDGLSPGAPFGPPWRDESSRPGVPPSSHRDATNRRGAGAPPPELPPDTWREACLDEAFRELLIVHRRELARLLLLAAGIVVHRSSHPFPLATFPVAPLSLQGWRRRTRHALELCSADRLSFSASGLLHRLLRRDPGRWPGLLVLTGAARGRGAGILGELCHGHALLRGDRIEEAEELFRSLLAQDPPSPVRWRAFEGLAAAHAAAGRPLLAMGAMEMAADEPSCGVGPLASGLYLALVAGDRRRCRRAAARLDLLVGPDEPAFVAAVRRIQDHAQARGAPAGGPASRTMEALVRDGGCGLAPGGSSSAERLLAAIG